MQTRKDSSKTDARSLTRGERMIGIGLLAVVFACGLFDHTLWSGNDSREGAMIAEMFRTGTWVTPVFNGTPYLEKPPLLHWTGLVLCHLCGMVNEGLVRLPAALFGFGAALLVYLWARDMGRERAGLAAAFMCATSVHYFEYSKVVLTDMAITFMVILSLRLFLKAYCAEGRRSLAYALFMLASALSFYAKGLLGPGCVWLAVCAFLLHERRWKLFLVLPLIFLPVLALVLAPWVAALWRAGGIEMLKSVFWDNQAGRFLSFSDPALPKDPFFVHKEPIYFYLVKTPPRLMPWALLVPPALVYWFRKGKGLGTLPAVFLRFALLAILLILHVSTAKAKAYALPLYPLIFLMVGIWLDDAVKEGMSRIERWLVGLTFGVAAAVLMLAPLVFIAGVLFRLDVIWSAGSDAVILCSVLALLAAFNAFCAAAVFLREYLGGARKRLVLPAFAIIAGLVVIEAGMIYPVHDNQRTYVPFVELVRKEMENGRRIALASPNERDCGQFMFYLDRRIEVAVSGAEMAKALCGSGGPAGLIVPADECRRAIRHLSIACDDRAAPLPGPYERPFRTLRSDHRGYKSRDFVLLLNENEPRQ